MIHEYGYNWTPAKGQTTGLERTCTRLPCWEHCGPCVSKDYCEKYARYREAKRWEKKGG